MNKEIENLKSRIKTLERDLEEIPSYYALAKAICEIQEALEKMNPELMLVNKIYAPTKVGMK
tara:strand:- start:1040 stop:1225 length:186 start_codon:yes stop_codon:yes gene_type:complete